LGHSKVGFTLDVYAHLLAGMDEDAAGLLDQAVRTLKVSGERPSRPSNDLDFVLLQMRKVARCGRLTARWRGDLLHLSSGGSLRNFSSI
jgi:hypothetical protein